MSEPGGEVRRLARMTWMELAELAASPRAEPSLRRHAERLLRGRCPDLALGERVALARRATPGIVGVLAESDEPAVQRALLGNERVVEADVVRIAGAARTPPEVLADIAEHARWGGRRSVRLALVENRRTPVAAALRGLRGLARGDLRRIRDNPEIRGVVRIGAERALAPESERGTAAGPAARRDHA